ncbi:MAG TPA: type II secretion system F family protein [Azospirillum sp.]|nr:type II secretion system F family protein [Azospirillum sp.]
MSGFSDIQIAYLLLFASTIFLVEGVYYFLRDRNSSAAGINRRMRLIAAGKDRKDVLGTLRRADLDPVSAALVRVMPVVERLIREAGLTVTPRRLLTVCALVGLVTGGLLSLTNRLPSEMVVLCSIAFGAALPTLVLMQRRRQRLKAFGEQLPEALEMMVRSLHAGHPIASAISMVANEMADPVGTEFGIAVDEMTYGLDLNTALRNLTSRIPHPDLNFFVVAVQIQNQTGGNLAEVLGNLASVIRDRFTLKMKVKVITTQGRSSVFVLAAMPFVTIAVLNLLSKEYFGEVIGHALFAPSMGLAFGLWAAGLAVIVKLLHFRF